MTVTGAPTFAFDVGGAETAAYQGGSGTGTLVFSYQVMPGDSDTNGIAWAANALTGGTIVEMGGTEEPTRTVVAESVLGRSQGERDADRERHGHGVDGDGDLDAAADGVGVDVGGHLRGGRDNRVHRDVQRAVTVIGDPSSRSR